MCVSSNGTTCGAGDWNQGWIVTTDGASAAAMIYHEDAISNLFHITTGGTNEFDFQPTGVDTTTGTFTICRYSPVGPNERVLTIDAIGRASISRTTTGSCP
jgi:type IV fimbrial biogenesis protein FimT